MTYAFDPEIAAAIPLLPDMRDVELQAQRKQMGELFAALPPVDTTGVTIEDRLVPGAVGDPQVPIRIYRPTA